MYVCVLMRVCVCVCAFLHMYLFFQDTSKCVCMLSEVCVCVRMPGLRTCFDVFPDHGECLGIEGEGCDWLHWPTCLCSKDLCHIWNQSDQRDPMKVLPVPLRYGPIKTVSLGLECDEVLKRDLSELLCLLTQDVGWNCT